MKTAVITGDIVNSRNTTPETWLPVLKSALLKYGTTPEQWEIYRGDSFQLEINPKDALPAAIYLKVCIKQLPNIDVRLSIGIGDKTHQSDRVSESNGSAFTRSGEALSKIGKKLLSINTPNTELNDDLNLYLELSGAIMDNWNELSAIVIKEHIDHPKNTQEQLLTYVQSNEQLAKLKERDKRVSVKNQSNISLILSRSKFELIEKMIPVFEQKINQL